MSFDTGTVTPVGIIDLLEGCRVYLLPTSHIVPGETLGPVRAAALSSSLSFVEVLLGTWRFGELGAWWDFSGGRSGRGSTFV